MFVDDLELETEGAEIVSSVHVLKSILHISNKHSSTRKEENASWYSFDFVLNPVCDYWSIWLLIHLYWISKSPKPASKRSHQRPETTVRCYTILPGQDTTVSVTLFLWSFSIGIRDELFMPTVVAPFTATISSPHLQWSTEKNIIIVTTSGTLSRNISRKRNEK